MYPTPQEKSVIEAAEKIMRDTMARYDPSHDAYHGEHQTKSTRQGINLPRFQCSVFGKLL